MSIKGELKDISLTGLIQMICLEQRQTALIIRHDHVEEGVIFFEDGEIVHARTGSLVGEDAIFQLLQWEGGSFRMGDEVKIPHRTIHSPWRYLLLEGLKKVDESSVGMGITAVSAPILTAEQKEADENLETKLIQILSQLEFERTKLAERQTRKRPSQFLSKLAEMINITATLVTHQQPRIDLNYILEICREDYQALRLLPVQNNQLPPTIIANLYTGWTASRSNRQNIFSEISRGLHEVLKTSFKHITNSFHNPQIAEQWQETCHLFLEELQIAIQSVKF